MNYISLFKDKIRIGSLAYSGWGDKIFGFSLDNGLYDYDQFIKSIIDKCGWTSGW